MNNCGIYTKYVNVFHGNGEIKPAQPQGVVSSWHMIKGLAGNTHPGAQLPFGKLSVGCYSGGYPTGYGNNCKNYGEPIEPLYDEKKIIGITHIHHSGVGGIGYYYNYALTVPYFGELRCPDLQMLCCEEGRPGYYSCRMDENNIGIEVTTDNLAARHRYNFRCDGGNISIDFTNDGLYDYEGIRSFPGETIITITSPHTVTAEVVLQGIKLYFCVSCTSGKAVLWKNYEKIIGNSLNIGDKEIFDCGCTFEGCNDGAEICVSVSLHSVEKAISDNIEASKRSFDDVVLEAERIWDKALSAIDIEADNENLEIFYSNLYHTLVKPSDWSVDNVFDNDDNNSDFVLDFSTLWDIYKTQLPLVFTLFPEISRKIIRTYLKVGKNLGKMPNTLGLCDNLNVESNQAKMLAGSVFCDAFYRGIGGVDWSEVCDAVYSELLGNEYHDFFINGECERTTHTLDLAECCGNIADMAEKCGRGDITEKLRPHENKWINAFDPTTGLLKQEYEYYEGNLWNYSFRLMRKMEDRIKLCGGKFTEYLDRFFGFTDASDISARFEGFNNETDMETPYAYAYTQHHDRLCEVIYDGMRSMFVSGEGGIPGNNDSGGLSSCYIWNVIGIFPVSGQDLMLIGTPAFRRVTLRLANDKTFTVKRFGDGIYVRSAELNGRELSSLRFSVSDMMCGGELIIFMSEEPIHIEGHA